MTTRHALPVSVVCIFAGLLLSCSEPPRPSPPTQDTGADTGPDVRADTGEEMPDTSGPEDTAVPEDTGDTGPSDTGESMDTETDVGPEVPPTEADHLCSGAGVSSGGGFQLVHCVGPGEAGAGDSKGGGFQLQTGALRVITRD